MPHPLVTQLRFTRSEFQRALEGVTDEEARQRFMPMNSISWMIGHLASQEQRYWFTVREGRTIVAEANEQAYGKPATTPPLADTWAAWHTIIAEVDAWMETLTSEQLLTHFMVDGEPWPESIGSMLRRVTYHYWFHLGESQAIRQLQGHTNLGEFVGAIHDEAPYVPELNIETPTV